MDNGDIDRVVIECFGVRVIRSLGHVEGGSAVPELVARYTHGVRQSHPDLDAARLIGLVDTELDGVALLHSTSWRFDPVHGVILTYVCCPDPQPDLIGDLVAAASGHNTSADDNPSRPHDPRTELADVLHHGIDHLAWLDDHHPQLTRSASDVAPEAWTAIRSAGRHRAGQRTQPLRTNDVWTTSPSS